jgi:hypothetical protein
VGGVFFPMVDSCPAPFGFVLFFWAVPLISIFQHSFVISKPVYTNLGVNCCRAGK